jgi:hypothetical protein
VKQQSSSPSRHKKKPVIKFLFSSKFITKTSISHESKTNQEAKCLQSTITGTLNWTELVPERRGKDTFKFFFWFLKLTKISYMETNSTSALSSCRSLFRASSSSSNFVLILHFYFCDTIIVSHRGSLSISTQCSCLQRIKRHSASCMKGFHQSTPT